MISSKFLQKCTPGPLLKVAILIFSVFIVTSHFSATQALAAQATLSWSAPVNADGTAVTSLKGYKVHVGTAAGNYSQHIDVGNVTTYNVTNLNDGATYYTAVSDYDTSGTESGYSNEVSKTFPAGTATYTITATAGSGGTITAVNNTTANTATNGTSTITSATITSGCQPVLHHHPGHRLHDCRGHGRWRLCRRRYQLQFQQRHRQPHAGCDIYRLRHHGHRQHWHLPQHFVRSQQRRNRSTPVPREDLSGRYEIQRRERRNYDRYDHRHHRWHPLQD